MYLRPRQIGEKFIVQEKITRVDPTGRILIEFRDTGEILFGVMSQLNPKEVEKWQGTKHESTNEIVQYFGRTKANVGDKLIKNNIVYLVQWIEDIVGTGWRIYYVKERGGRESRYLVSGKDAEIRDADGNLLSTVDQWQAQVTFNNATYQPLGAAQQMEHMISYSVTLAITECIIEDDKFIQDAFDFMKNGRHAPMWVFSSILKGYDGSESRYVFRDCVPSGQWDLHNVSQGDIIKRTLNMHVNRPPSLQKVLTAPSED